MELPPNKYELGVYLLGDDEMDRRGYTKRQFIPLVERGLDYAIDISNYDLINACMTEKGYENEIH